MPNNIIKSFADKSGKTENEVEKLWNELKTEYKDDYEKITRTLKKILKIDESSKGTYVARKVKNAESLYNHYKNQGVNVIPMEELHCTIAYSKKEFKPKLNSKDIEIMYDEDIYPYLEPLGNDGCIVMKFKSKEMTERWQDCIDRGAIYDYESYIPHITIAIDEKDLDLKSIRKPDFNIILSNEYTEELDLNWKDKLTESINIKSIKEKFKDYFKKINIYEYDDKVSIDLIISNEKNQGYGTKLMNEIIDYCDKTNKTIILTPSDEFGGNKKRLIEFYKRFGFLENKGKNKIFGIFESMYRLPKNKQNENYKGLNMEIEKLVEGLGKAKLSFVTKAMIKEGVVSLTEDKLNEYLDLFEEYKNVVLESEKFAELVEGKDVDSLSESEIEDLIEKCSEEMDDDEEDEEEDKDENEDDIKENYIGKAMLELSKGNTGSAIENFKLAMLSTLSKNETYQEIDNKMSLYVNEAKTRVNLTKQELNNAIKIFNTKGEEELIKDIKLRGTDNKKDIDEIIRLVKANTPI